MGYLGALFCGFIAFAAFGDGSTAGFIIGLGAGILVFPPIWNKLAERGASFHWAGRWLIAAVAVFLAVLFAASTPEHKRQVAEREAEKLAEQKMADAAEGKKLAAENLANQKEKASGEHCLSGWDGSFPDLKDAVKMGLRNPGSFEHVNTVTSPVDDKGTFGLIMTYRAENGFGGMNVEAIGVEVEAQSCDFKRASERSLAARLKS